VAAQGGYFRKRILIGNPRGEAEGDQPRQQDHGGISEGPPTPRRARAVAMVRSALQPASTIIRKSPLILFDKAAEKKIPGVAEDLRKSYPNLRTVQIVYALLLTGTTEPELVRLVVKGSSLAAR